MMVATGRESFVKKLFARWTRETAKWCGVDSGSTRGDLCLPYRYGGSFIPIIIIYRTHRFWGGGDRIDLNFQPASSFSIYPHPFPLYPSATVKRSDRSAPAHIIHFTSAREREFACDGFLFSAIATADRESHIAGGICWSSTFGCGQCNYDTSASALLLLSSIVDTRIRYSHLVRIDCNCQKFVVFASTRW